MSVSVNHFFNIHTHRNSGNMHDFIIRNVYLHKCFRLPTVPYALSVGLHPWYIHQLNLQETIDRLIDLCSNKQVLAIGEIGIDRAIRTPIHIQQQYFDAQLNVARALQKPVIIHCVRAYSDILLYLKKYKIPFVFHGFRGNLQQANELIKHGAYLSFGEALSDAAVAKVFGQLPIERCLFETDVSAVSIQQIYCMAANIKNISVDVLKKQQFDSFAALFNNSL